MTGLQFVKLGADVIKVEPPRRRAVAARRPVRRRRAPTPSAASRTGTTTAASAASSSTSTSDDGRGRARSRCSPPPTCSSSPCIPDGCGDLGLDLAAIAAAHPRLIVVSITDFGLTGPWAEYQLERPRRPGHERPADHLRLRRPLDPADPPRRQPGVPHRRQLRPPGRAARPAPAPADRRRRADRRLDPGGRRR